jgi:hypothetical protein
VTDLPIRPSLLPSMFRELDDIIEGLGEDEVRVLLRIARRIAKGRTQYGALHLATDPRDFQNEAREEIEDSLVYFACRWLKEAP